MKGLEMMLANMIGMKPDEMRVKLEQFEQFVSGGAEALKSIAATQQQILDRLSAMEAATNGTGK